MGKTPRNIHDAKTHFSELVAEVEQGGEVVIARAGKPVARLVPYETPQPRKPGLLKGKIWMAPDFDACDAEIARMFEESHDPFIDAPKDKPGGKK
jgi:prevent-host-death family protein